MGAVNVSSITLPSTTMYAIAMTCPTNSGGKDWVGCVCTLNGQSAIKTWWGPAGKLGQTAEKAGGRPQLNTLISEKIAKGYTFEDEFIQLNGTMQWQSQTPAKIKEVKASKEMPEPPKPPPKINIIAKAHAPTGALDLDF